MERKMHSVTASNAKPSMPNTSRGIKNGLNKDGATRKLEKRGTASAEDQHVHSDILAIKNQPTQSPPSAKDISTADDGSRPNAQCAVCASTQKATSAVAYCKECCDKLCALCSYCHSRTRPTMNHHVVMYRPDAGSVDSGDSRPWRRPCKPCGAHPDKILEAYCLPCAKMICLQCKLLTHGAHLCTDLEPAAEEQRRRVEANVTRIRNSALTEADDVLGKCRSRIEEAERWRSQTCECVAERFHEMERELTSYSTALTVQLNAQYTIYADQVNRIADAVSERREEFVKLLSLSQGLLADSTDDEVLASKHSYDEAFDRVVVRWSAPQVPHLQHTNFYPSQAGASAVGILFGSFAKGSAENAERNSSPLLHRVRDETGRLPCASSSGRIYDYHATLLKNNTTSSLDGDVTAEPAAQIATAAPTENGGEAELGKPGGRSRAHSQLAKVGRVKVIGMPKLTLRKVICQGSVTHIAAKHDGNGLVAAVFCRSGATLGASISAIERVRILDVSTDGVIRKEFRAGSVLYGLAVGPEGQIVTAGGDLGPNSRRINIFTADGELLQVINCNDDVGGVAVNRFRRVVAAVGKDITFHSIDEGSLEYSFGDISGNISKDYQRLRKLLAVGTDEQIYVCDPNTNSVRGYNRHGEFLFEYGQNTGGAEMLFRPKAISVDSYGHVIVADATCGRLHILSAKGVFRCALLEDCSGGPLYKPRAVAACKLTQVAIGQQNGELRLYQYLFDEQ